MCLALSLTTTLGSRQILFIDSPTLSTLTANNQMSLMSKRKAKLYLVNDCGGEWEDAWNEPVIAFANQEDATRCAVTREHRQSLCNSGFGYRDYSGSFITEIDAVIDDSIFAPNDVRDE